MKKLSVVVAIVGMAISSACVWTGNFDAFIAVNVVFIGAIVAIETLLKKPKTTEPAME